MSAIPASSITTRVDGPILPAQSGRSCVDGGPGEFGEGVGVGVDLVAQLRPRRPPTARARSRCRRPSVQAAARARIAVVLPVPAGAIASCSRAPEVAICRTSAACPAFRVTPLAAASSSATSTAAGDIAWPSQRPAVSTSRCSAARMRVEVNSSDPATV